MTDNKNQSSFPSIAILVVAIILLIGNILFHTQESYLINYFGKQYEGNIVSVDSTHTGYSKYRFQYKVNLQNGKRITIAEGNFKKKTHEVGQHVKIKIYKNKSEFESQVPNMYITLFLGGLLVFFIRAYFVFRKTS